MRHVDFLVVDKDQAFKPMLAIELDGDSHKQYRQYKSDNFKNQVFKDNNLPLIRFNNSIPINVYNKAMTKVNPTSKAKKQEYETEIELIAGGNYGYTFRAVPKHKMLMNFADMDLIKWEVKEDK